MAKKKKKKIEKVNFMDGKRKEFDLLFVWIFNFAFFFLKMNFIILFGEKNEKSLFFLVFFCLK